MNPIQSKVLPACKFYPTRTHHFAPASISPEKTIGVCMCGLAQDKPTNVSQQTVFRVKQ